MANRAEYLFALSAMSHESQLTLRGVRENNLKDLDLTLAHNKLIVITGVSGSGKSTLAFDTIYAEGGRRYIETFSPYTRQFLDRLHQPDLDSAEGIRPALALEQRNRTTTTRSTVGTVTELNDYLKVLWSQIAVQICPKCGAVVKRFTPIDVCDEIFKVFQDGYSAVILGFRLKVSNQVSISSFCEVLQSQGFIRFFDSKKGEVQRLSELTEGNLQNESLLIVLDRVNALGDSTEFRKRFVPSIFQAYHFGRGELELVYIENGGFELKTFQEAPSCTACGQKMAEPKPAMFSFNSPLGACKTCNGFGKTLELDLNKCIPDTTKSIEEGAIKCWTSKRATGELRELKKFCKEREIDLTTPWNQLSEKERNLIYYGSGERKGYYGIVGWFDWLKTKRHKMHVRIFLSRHRSEVVCPDCKGGRLQSEANYYLVDGRTIQEIWNLPLEDLDGWLDRLSQKYLAYDFIQIPLEEVRSRVSYLNLIGLGYLTLDRQTKTLSGGEFQRVNLASILGTRLTNTTLILDEPTIGLHPRDTSKLIEILELLRNRGNSVIVVEHEPEVMRAADEILDIGPGAGKAGGEIVYQGPVSGILAEKRSLTGKYLAGELELAPAENEKIEKGRGKKIQSRHLLIKGATLHNLQNIDVKIPLGKFVVVTGVSGSGKSTLVHKCLYDSARILLGRPGSEEGDEAAPSTLSVKSIYGLDAVKDVLLVNQTPIGKTPRSNSATYTGTWDIIREILAESTRAAQLGLGKSAFSFNVDGGRCPHCKGAGAERIEMQFLADVFVECEKCGGTRFKDTVLTVRLGGKNVKEILELSLDESLEFFKELAEEKRYRKLKSLLSPLIELGLGYLTLGQPLSELSGGEAQRVKLASYLAEGGEGKYLFILDEPTTGLHPYNIKFLLASFQKLLQQGHSILCVEHNKDLIMQADWMIDLGPEAGASGGKVVVEGEPNKLVQDVDLAAKSLTIRELQRPKKLNIVAKIPAGVVKPKQKMVEAPPIEIVGAKEHNLRNVSIKIPSNNLTVVTGVSGSGKSTLAFDILFQEGQRRYIDSLSPYARQYITHLKRADVERVENIPPTVAVSQKTAPPLGVSTVGTTTEIYQFLRLLFSKVGIQRCTKHDLPIEGLSRDEIIEEILNYAQGTRVFIFAPVISGRKGYYNDLFQRALVAEIEEARVDGKLIRIQEDLRLERHKLHWISLLVGSFSNLKQTDGLLQQAVEQALLLGSGTVEVVLEDKKAEPRVFSSERVCPKCKRGFRELDPQDFSFRSLRGVCQRCGGRGVTGEGEREQICVGCDGARISEVGRSVTIFDKRIYELSRLAAPELLKFFETTKFSARLAPIVEPVVRELKHRLQVIVTVGLDYLSLDRDASTLSGGEAQRLRLAKTLGSPLTGICYVLDEPTIGLHPQDNKKLMEILLALRDQGNSVVVVEHDEETILLADHVIDMGPRGGTGGGRVIFEGRPADLMGNEESLTAEALKERQGREIYPVAKVKRKSSDCLRLEGAKANNLKNINAEFPLGAITVVCGVSGAGKSSLVHGALVPAITDEFEESSRKASTYSKILNHDSLKRYLEIDQVPVGKTSTSCPGSYLGIFDLIRKLFAQIPDAQVRGYTASYFSFNSGKGRCSSCEGKGYLKVPMSFLPDAVSECEACSGLRYSEAALDIQYQGLSIGEILKKTMSECRVIFANHSLIRRTLTYVEDLGIGYLTLGQPTHTLSGGEIQRLKLAKELGAREAVDTLYVLDEPTIGLHMKDVDRLIAVLKRLAARGNTVIVIEHNLDIVQAADHLIEIGPGPAEQGGKIVFSGSPSELLGKKVVTATSQMLKGYRDTLKDLAYKAERDFPGPELRQ